MIRRISIAAVTSLLGAAALHGALFARSGATEVPRGIRRDVPMTNVIRRAFDAGTRDLTGRPGKNYWQLQTDYTIAVRLDPAAGTLTGSETIVLHNNSPDALTQIVLRLDHNIFRGLVPRGSSVPAEITEGMVITRLAENGQAADLTAQPAGGRRGGGAGGAGGGQPAPSGPRVSGLDQTVARITPTTAIESKTTAKIEIEWRTKLPGGPGIGHRMTQRYEDRLFQPTQWYPRV